MVINKIQLLGPFNSGTNLMSNILQNNLSKNIIINEHTILWKHSIHKSKLIEAIVRNPDTLFICAYRPLINWIYSIEKSSYDIKWSNALKDEIEFRDTKYPSIVHLYNRYYLQYMELIIQFKRVIFFDYYKILETDNVINYINNKLNGFNLFIKPKNNVLEVLKKPSKDHGQSVKTSEEAVKKRDKQMEDFLKNPEKVLFINKNLDTNIKTFFDPIKGVK